MTPDALDLTPGAHTTAARVRAAFHGTSETRISGSRTSPDVFLYADPGARQERGHRVYDGWAESDEHGEVFHFTGTGLLGDQRMTLGNRAVLEHAARGGELHLFVADGHVGDLTTPIRYRYLGAFHLDPGTPYLERPLHVMRHRPVRAFVFRLRPVAGKPYDRDERDRAPADPESVRPHVFVSRRP
ncbi:hypothetical protein ACFQ0M_01410 [Kitasatospora aburaviensis]|uniref:ScoMcrA-like SRA domain-containing protein n=1 Tax=Kitasatospora aburaviensis TaxID=67265 RepID=A0ABW1EZ63_9ACTN